MGERKRRILCALLAAFLLLGSLAGCGSGDESAGAAETGFEAHFITPYGEFLLQSEKDGRLTLPGAEEIEGYVFRGWKNEAGEIERGQSVTLTEESYFAAVYAVDLIRDAHAPYLFPDSSARCRAQQPMTRGEAVQMFYSLLAVKVKGTESFADVPRGSELYEAASSLKTLSVMGGERLEPDAELTLGELLLMLTHFYPPPATDAVFADVAEDSPYYEACCLAAAQGWIDSGEDCTVRPLRILTRLETAELMNRVLLRGESLGEFADMQLLMPDLPEDEALRAVVMEAMVDHGFEGEGEERLWTSATMPYALIEGFTSEDIELDKLLKAILDETLKDEMNRDEQLRALYRYVRDGFRYRRGELYETGDVSWLVPEAKKLVKTGRGNCYSYAALLCELFRAVGVDAEPYSGTISGKPHAWVEADLDGVRYVFDVEMEYAYMRPPHNEYIDMFMKTYEEMARWKYDRG